MDSKCCIIIQINSINNNNTSVHSIEGLQCIIIKVKIIASKKYWCIKTPVPLLFIIHILINTINSINYHIQRNKCNFKGKS